MQKGWDQTVRLLALSEFAAFTKVTFQRSEQTEKTRTKWVDGGPEEGISMVFAIVNSRKQWVEFTASMYEWGTSTLIAAVIPTETERDYITKGNELL